MPIVTWASCVCKLCRDVNTVSSFETIATVHLTTCGERATRING